jgi:hypothetical protein
MLVCFPSLMSHIFLSGPNMLNKTTCARTALGRNVVRVGRSVSQLGGQAGRQAGRQLFGRAMSECVSE